LPAVRAVLVHVQELVCTVLALEVPTLECDLDGLVEAHVAAEPIVLVSIVITVVVVVVVAFLLGLAGTKRSYTHDAEQSRPRCK